MIGRFMRAGLLWPTLLSLIGLAILVGLGSWQLVRKAEKEALIAKIEARRSAEPMALGELLATRSLEQADFQRVRVSGELLSDKTRFYYAPQPKLGPGFDVYQPLRYAPGKVAWVNLGYIPQRVRGKPQTWKIPSGQVTITGNARLPAVPGFFTPENDVEGNIWYWRDVGGMHASAFEAGTDFEPAPFFIVAEPEKTLSAVDKAHLGEAAWLQRGVTDIVVLNRHLEYAITWYGLALTLLGVYLAYGWTRFRQTK
ncbi:MAG: hypothetical protein K0U74_10385 [Alphaproteobacteria bacterium]|nr:hypothetical protein [Alphaproteobacteria bacterium]